MLLNLLFTAPMLALAWIAALIIALTLHEFAHAAEGKWRGDDTAEKMGRLTLNPLAHLDPIGFLMLLALGSVGQSRCRTIRGIFVARNNDVIIALAGPAMNLALAIIGGVAFRLAVGGLDVLGTALGPFLVFFTLTNLMLAIFNMIPVHPLSGSKLVTVFLAGTSFEWISTWLLLRQPGYFDAILISIMTPYDPFSFIQIPAFCCAINPSAFPVVDC